MLKGIDVSNFQKINNYDLFNQNRLAFVFIKATEGIYKDRHFKIHNDGFARTCLLKGAYHYFRFKTKAKDQADEFINTVGTITDFDLPPVLDIEDITENYSQSTCETEIQIWLDTVENALNIKPIIYTGNWFWANTNYLNNSAKFKNYKLWVAGYGPNYLPMFGGWEHPTFWQYDDKGFVHGISGKNTFIDLNYYLDSIDNLWLLSRSKTLSPASFYQSKVEALQYILNLNGFNTGIQDGIFGNKTLEALHLWQLRNGLPQQDFINPKNWQSLFGLINI